jgi:hypothetical protein
MAEGLARFLPKRGKEGHQRFGRFQVDASHIDAAILGDAEAATKAGAGRPDGCCQVS